MTTTMQVPTRSRDQRAEALLLANEVRSWRAELKRDMKHFGSHDSAARAMEMIAQPPAKVQTMRVFDLMVAISTFGRVKVTKILRRAEISPSRTVGGLTPRQRAELLLALRPYGR